MMRSASMAESHGHLARAATRADSCEPAGEATERRVARARTGHEVHAQQRQHQQVEGAVVILHAGHRGTTRAGVRRPK
jgi:hypothetical protein